MVNGLITHSHNNRTGLIQLLFKSIAIRYEKEVFTRIIKMIYMIIVSSKLHESINMRQHATQTNLLIHSCN